MSNQTTDNDDSGLSTSMEKMKLDNNNQKEIENKAAIKIQSLWRGHNARKKNMLISDNMTYECMISFLIIL